MMAREKGNQVIDLQAYRWQQRLLLLFALDATQPAYVEQVARFASQQDALRERDLLIVHIFARGNGSIESTPIEADAAQLRNAYGVADDTFTVVLIGKDGGEKYRATQPIDPQELYAIIDVMPMRREEMGEQQTQP